MSDDEDDSKRSKHFPEARSKGLYVENSPSYEEVVESCGVKIELSESDDDYQGTTYALVQRASDGKYAVLSWGWGSCSGCDSLQACDSVEELDGLRERFVEDLATLEWRDRARECLKDVEEVSDDAWHADSRKKFRAALEAM